MNSDHTSPAQRGFTALELIIVLIIGFSIIGLSAGKMGDMMDSSKATRALDSIFTLSTAIKSLANPQGYGAASADLVPDLVKAGIVPKSLRPGGTASAPTLTNEWNKEIGIAVDGNDVQKFSIIYPGVPKAACNKLVKDLLGNFTVGLLPADAGAGVTATPVDRSSSMSQIATSCNAVAAQPITLVLTD